MTAPNLTKVKIKTDKVEKCQNKLKCNKESTKPSLGSSVLASYYWALGLPWSVAVLQGHAMGEKEFPLAASVSADGFLVRGGILCPLSSPSAETHQARTSAGPVYTASLCEFICMSVPVCPEGTVPTGQS